VVVIATGFVEIDAKELKRQQENEKKSLDSNQTSQHVVYDKQFSSIQQEQKSSDTVTAHGQQYENSVEHEKFGAFANINNSAKLSAEFQEPTTINYHEQQQSNIPPQRIPIVQQLPAVHPPQISQTHQQKMVLEQQSVCLFIIFYLKIFNILRPKLIIGKDNRLTNLMIKCLFKCKRFFYLYLNTYVNVFRVLLINSSWKELTASCSPLMSRKCKIPNSFPSFIHLKVPNNHQPFFHLKYHKHSRKK